jgi:hypothetical protein
METEMGKLVHCVEKEGIGNQKQRCPNEIDPELPALFRCLLQSLPCQVSPQERDRNIDVEVPAPSYRVDEEASECRASKKAYMECHGSESQGASPLLRGKGNRHDRPSVCNDH